MIQCIFNPDYNFNVLSCDEGEFITSYTDEQDIKEFSSFTIAYCPVNADTSIYRVITAEENEAYQELQRQAIEEERNRAEENRAEE